MRKPKAPSDWRPVHGFAIVVLMAVSGFVPVFRVWPLLWMVPLAGYAGLVLLVKPLRASFQPWRCGRVSRFGAMATTVIAAGACVVLVAFHHFQRPAVRHFADFLPVTFLGSVIGFGVLFSLLNALLEEVIFRGILFDALESQWGGRLAVLGSALLFGYGHMQGYPPGPMGAVLAGVFGVCLGWLRVVTGGLALPVVAHVVADATIFTLLTKDGAWGI